MKRRKVALDGPGTDVTWDEETNGEKWFTSETRIKLAKDAIELRVCGSFDTNWRLGVETNDELNQ